MIIRLLPFISQAQLAFQGVQILRVRYLNPSKSCQVYSFRSVSVLSLLKFRYLNPIDFSIFDRESTNYGR